MPCRNVYPLPGPCITPPEFKGPARVLCGSRAVQPSQLVRCSRASHVGLGQVTLTRGAGGARSCLPAGPALPLSLISRRSAWFK